MRLTFELAAALTLALACAGAARATTGDFRCLTSESSAQSGKPGAPTKPIRLQFDFPATAKDAGFVTYQNGSGRIAVRPLAHKEERTAEGRPSEFTTTYKEADPGGGTYTVVSQGARIYGFTYRRARDGKTFAFDEDLEAMSDTACNWASK